MLMSPDDLKKWREAHGLGQAELARLLGVAPNTVWRWEVGMRVIPPLLPLAIEAVEARLKKQAAPGAGNRTPAE